MPDRVPLYKIEMFVDEHDTKEPADTEKPDVYTVTLKAHKDQFKIGLQDAKAKLQIKALDDIVKHQFPLFGEFMVEIYPVPKTRAEKHKSTPTTLVESTHEDSS